MKELTIPEGRVVKLYSSGKLLWERQGDVQTFDYLQFPGTAYFNTGVIQNQDTVAEIWANDVVWNNRSMFGARNASRNRSLVVHLNANQMLLDFASSRLVVPLTELDATRQHIVGGAGRAEYTNSAGVQISWEYVKAIWTASSHIVIGAMNTNGGISNLSTYKLERFKITQGDALLADYLPSVTSQGLFCLYNRADGSFLLPVGEVTCGDY